MCTYQLIKQSIVQRNLLISLQANRTMLIEESYHDVKTSHSTTMRLFVYHPKIELS